MAHVIKFRLPTFLAPASSCLWRSSQLLVMIMDSHRLVITGTDATTGTDSHITLACQTYKPAMVLSLLHSLAPSMLPT